LNNNLENDHILRLAIARRVSSETDKGTLGALPTIGEIVTPLYVEDFETFVKQTIGTRDLITGVTRLEAYKKARTISSAHVALRVALFATTTNPWNLSREELQWIIYLFNDKYTILDVWNMSKNELVFNHRHIAADLPNRAILRRDVELLNDEKVPLRCIDVAYRSLVRLQGLHERLEVQKESQEYGQVLFERTVDSSFQLACEPWNQSQSLIISVAELEGAGDSQGPKGDATQSSGAESGTHPSAQVAPGTSGSTPDTLDAQAMMDKYLADAQIWAESERRKYAKATAAALAAVDDTTEAFIDRSNIEEQSKEWIHLETLKHTRNAYGVEIGSRLHGGDITINTKTTLCVLNHSHGRAHSVIQKRPRNAFVIKVSLFRELVQNALGTINGTIMMRCLHTVGW
jgi:hypothetical protein